MSTPFYFLGCLTVLTASGNYQIDKEFSYQLEGSDRLVPTQAFGGPVIHLKPLAKAFHAGWAPRFQFEGSNMKDLYFAAAPDGELYLADMPRFQELSDEKDPFSAYPMASLDRPYEKGELENWYWYPFLMEALRLALEARKKGDHPFGAVLIEDGKIILRASNTVNTDQDFTAHAERNLESLAGKFSATTRAQSILLTSTEPCAMCAAGSVWTGIGSIVYGLSSLGLSAITGHGSFVVPSRDLLSHAKKPIQVTGPLFEGISAMVHQGFWR